MGTQNLGGPPSKKRMTAQASPKTSLQHFLDWPTLPVRIQGEREGSIATNSESVLHDAFGSNPALPQITSPAPQKIKNRSDVPIIKNRPDFSTSSNTALIRQTLPTPSPSFSSDSTLQCLDWPTLPAHGIAPEKQTTKTKNRPDVAIKNRPDATTWTNSRRSNGSDAP